MSCAVECYGMLSMTMGLQPINQTRGLVESLAGPRAKSVHMWLIPVPRFQIGFGLVSVVWSHSSYRPRVAVSLPPTSSCDTLFLMAALILSLFITPPALEAQKDREKDTPGDCFLHPFTALSSPVPGYDRSRQNVILDLISQFQRPSFFFFQNNKHFHFLTALVYEYMHLLTKLVFIYVWEGRRESEGWLREECEWLGEADRRVNWIVGKMQILYCFFELGGGVSTDWDCFLYLQTHTHTKQSNFFTISPNESELFMPPSSHHPVFSQIATPGP